MALNAHFTERNPVIYGSIPRAKFCPKIGGAIRKRKNFQKFGF
jgi:hypothetical protein